MERVFCDLVALGHGGRRLRLSYCLETEPNLVCHREINLAHVIAAGILSPYDLGRESLRNAKILSTRGLAGLRRRTLGSLNKDRSPPRTW